MPVWSSEESSTVDTEAGGACWARLLNQNYAIGNITATIMWNLVTSFYTSLPYYGASLMNAGQPWSGNYEVRRFWLKMRRIVANCREFRPILGNF